MEPSDIAYESRPRIPSSLFCQPKEDMSHEALMFYKEFNKWGKKYIIESDLEYWRTARITVYCREIIARMHARLTELKSVVDREPNMNNENIHLFTKPFICLRNYGQQFKDTYLNGTKLTYDIIAKFAEDADMRSRISQDEVKHTSQKIVDDLLVMMLDTAISDYKWCLERWNDVLLDYTSEYNILNRIYRQASSYYMKVVHMCQHKDDVFATTSTGKPYEPQKHQKSRMNASIFSVRFTFEK